MIGDVRVTRIVELEVPTNPTFLYKEMVPEAFVPYHSWLMPHFVDENGRILMAIQSFVVESERSTHRGRHVHRQRQAA